MTCDATGCQATNAQAAHSRDCALLELVSCAVEARTPPLSVARQLLAHEAEFHLLCAALMVFVGCVVWCVEFYGSARAPYGRYASIRAASWYGPMINAKVAWFFQESWAFFTALLLLPFGEPRCLESRPNAVLLAMFMGHYAYRSFVYPFRMRGGKPMPIGICMLAALFCAFNGLLQGRLWSAIAVRTLDTPFDAAVFASGCLVWAVGLGINLHSDSVLRNLRKPGESGYKIPHGGAFRFVSAANYFGEIVEWLGYALAANHFGAVAFAGGGRRGDPRDASPVQLAGFQHADHRSAGNPLAYL